MGQPIRSMEDRKKLQAALDGLVKWADQWGMAFKVDKCKVMHIGHANPLHEYSMNGKKLAQTDKEKDLGVIVASNLKPGGQCAKAAGTGQAVLGQLARAFHFRDRYVFLAALQDLCETPAKICGSVMVSMDSSGQGSARKGAEKGNKDGIRTKGC